MGRVYERAASKDHRDDVDNFLGGNAGRISQTSASGVGQCVFSRGRNSMTNIPHQIESGGLVIDGQHRLLAQAWDCAFAELPMAYLSGPITGGPRFIQWYDTRGQLIKDKKNYKAEHHANVVQPNERDLRDTARQLRLRLGQTIVEPASLQVTDWSQHDYMTLWVEFIEKHAARVIMMPGWEYSSGWCSRVRPRMRAWHSCLFGRRPADCDPTRATAPSRGA